MIDCLFRGKFRNRGKNRESITSEENDVFRMSTNSGQFSVRNVLKGI